MIICWRNSIPGDGEWVASRNARTTWEVSDVGHCVPAAHSVRGQPKRPFGIWLLEGQSIINLESPPKAPGTRHRGQPTATIPHVPSLLVRYSLPSCRHHRFLLRSSKVSLRTSRVPLTLIRRRQTHIRARPSGDLLKLQEHAPADRPENRRHRAGSRRAQVCTPSPSLPSPSPGLSSTEATTMTAAWPNYGSVMPYPGNPTAFEEFTPLILTFKY